MSQRIIVHFPSGFIMPLPQDLNLQNQLIAVGLVFDKDGNKVDIDQGEALSADYWCVPFAKLLLFKKAIANKLKDVKTAEIEFSYFDISFLGSDHRDVLDKIFAAVMPATVPEAFKSEYWLKNGERGGVLLGLIKAAYEQECSDEQLNIKELIGKYKAGQLQDAEKERLYNYYVPYITREQNDQAKRDFDGILGYQKQNTERVILEALLPHRLAVSPSIIIAALRSKFFQNPRASDKIIYLTDSVAQVNYHGVQKRCGEDVEMFHMPTYDEALAEYHRKDTVARENKVALRFEKPRNALLLPLVNVFMQFANPIELLAHYLDILDKTSDGDLAERYHGMQTVLISHCKEHTATGTLHDSLNQGLNDGFRRLANRLASTSKVPALDGVGLAKILDKTLFAFTMNYHGRVFQKPGEGDADEGANKYYHQPLITLLPNKFVAILKKVDEQYKNDDILFSCFFAWIAKGIEKYAQGTAAETYVNNFWQMAIAFGEKGDEKDRAHLAIEAVVVALREQIREFSAGAEQRQQRVNLEDQDYFQQEKEKEAQREEDGAKNAFMTPTKTPCVKRPVAQGVTWAADEDLAVEGRRSRAVSVTSLMDRSMNAGLMEELNLSDKEKGDLLLYRYPGLARDTNVEAFLKQRLRVPGIDKDKQFFPVIKKEGNIWFIVALMKDDRKKRTYWRLNPITHRLEPNLPLQDNPIMIIEGVKPVDKQGEEGQEISLVVTKMCPDAVYLGKPRGSGLDQPEAWNAYRAVDFDEESEFDRTMKKLLRYYEGGRVVAGSPTENALIELCIALAANRIDGADFTSLNVQNLNPGSVEQLERIKSVVNELERLKDDKSAIFNVDFSTKNGAVATLNDRVRAKRDGIYVLLTFVAVGLGVSLCKKNPYIPVTAGDEFFYIDPENTTLMVIAGYLIPIGASLLLLTWLVDRAIAIAGEFAKHSLISGAESQEAFATVVEAYKTREPLAVLPNAILDTVSEAQLERSQDLKTKLNDSYKKIIGLKSVVTMSTAIPPTAAKILKGGDVSGALQFSDEMRDQKVAESSHLQTIIHQSRIALGAGLVAMIASLGVAGYFAYQFYTSIQDSANGPGSLLDTDGLYGLGDDDAAKLSKLTLSSINVLGLAILSYVVLTTASFVESGTFLALRFYNWWNTPAEPQAAAEQQPRSNWLSLTSLWGRRGAADLTVNADPSEKERLLEEGRRDVVSGSDGRYGAVGIVNSARK